MSNIFKAIKKINPNASITVRNNDINSIGIILSGTRLVTAGGAVVLNGSGDQGIAIENGDNINAGIATGSVTTNLHQAQSSAS